MRFNFVFASWYSLYSFGYPSVANNCQMSIVSRHQPSCLLDEFDNSIQPPNRVIPSPSYPPSTLMTNCSHPPLIRHFDHLPGDAAFVGMTISLVALPMLLALVFRYD